MTIPRIAVDAMGGDHAPHVEVAAALMAATQLEAEIVLVGDELRIRADLLGKGEHANLRVVHAPEVIGMDENPTDAIRAKPGASINVALELVKAGEADAFVTMGNTGAAMAGALLKLGRVRGISRPALAIVTNSGSGLTMLLDVGANAECRPIHLVQFAHMASAVMQGQYHVSNPRIGLLSIGEEDSKGNDLVIEVNGLLRQSNLNFVGNLEGKDLAKGLADVVVMDGFSGNVVLKTVEGIADLLFGEIRAVANKSLINKVAGMILRRDLRQVAGRLDYSEYGGAHLLGVNGVTVIGHGRSNERAIFNAIRAAREAVASDVVGLLRQVAEEIPARSRVAATGGDASEDTPD